MAVAIGKIGFVGRKKTRAETWRAEGGQREKLRRGRASWSDAASWESRATRGYTELGGSGRARRGGRVLVERSEETAEQPWNRLTDPSPRTQSIARRFPRARREKRRRMGGSVTTAARPGGSSQHTRPSADARASRESVAPGELRRPVKCSHKVASLCCPSQVVLAPPWPSRLPHRAASAESRKPRRSRAQRPRRVIIESEHCWRLLQMRISDGSSSNPKAALWRATCNEGRTVLPSW